MRVNYRRNHRHRRRMVRLWHRFGILPKHRRRPVWQPTEAKLFRRDVAHLGRAL